MKVRELIAKLQECNGDDEVYCYEETDDGRVRPLAINNAELEWVTTDRLDDGAPRMRFGRGSEARQCPMIEVTADL